MPQFAICRTTKIKCWTTLSKSVGHTLRTTADDRPHLDSSVLEPIRILSGSTDWIDHWKVTVGAMYLPKLKQGTLHTLAREFFLGMSPEWAEHKTEEDIAEWAAANVAWLRTRFGADRVKLAVLHRDEQTPHIAAYVVGLKTDANRRGELRTDRGNGWTLSDGVLRLGGNKNAMIALQDEYAKAMDRFALGRGRPGSSATHQTIAAWRKQMSEPMRPIRVPAPPETTLLDRMDIASYGKRASKAAAENVYRQFKPFHQNSKLVDRLKKQVAAILFEVSRLRELVKALTQQRDFVIKALALVFGFEPDLDSQNGLARVLDSARELREKRQRKDISSDVSLSKLDSASFRMPHEQQRPRPDAPGPKY